ncbi:WLM-domain-containing protein [Sodiomyces alkalinus F11]|uniref:WLM-domain-containing protein n=1 Tax=Sodiomyces alkalinus (strain CBS 110278 / VKM F-3762 / F11) TaxID=1314773 RepID=A0A3N2Q6U4_SODAK|nr:WLM-domain-containing protein [Sodiomyces alkalinus F11]ROT42407.1 WLM-domain-containing protein [Sodiomyces alkalinus F11]
MADDHRTSDPVNGPADDITITITHRNTPHSFTFDSTATISDLSSTIELQLGIPAANQKFLIPKQGLQQPPFKNPSLPLAPLQSTKIQLLAPPPQELASLQAASDLAARRAQARAQAASRTAAKPFPTSRTSTRAREEETYTFLTLRPLPWLPRPDRSLAMLQRLKSDPGIRAAMRTHRFTVDLLTEMEPLSNTASTHEGTSRLLGLNRNKGEVIELRLRTDAHDGYRDYATVRRTLCHELAHNVHGDHDRHFWDLCRRIEREVDAVSAGRTTADDAGYSFAPARGGEEEEEAGEYNVQDHGGWQGGEFVVGGGEGVPSNQGLSRREILARAAEERLRRMNMERPDGGKPDSGPGTPG